jgi:hypothetical protein
MMKDKKCSIPYTFYRIERKGAETVEKKQRGKEKREKTRNLNHTIKCLLSATDPSLCVQKQDKNVYGSEKK